MVIMKKIKWINIAYLYILLLTIGIILQYIFAKIYDSDHSNNLIQKYSETSNLSSSCRKTIICQKCNVIFISLDSLRADHVHALGYPKETTPFLDSLINKGVTLSNFFTTSYLTPISEMSLHTGMYPSSNGFMSFQSSLPQSVLTISQLAHNAGFRTSALHGSPEFIAFTELAQSFNRGFDWYQQIPYRSIEPTVYTYIQDEFKSINSKRFFLWITLGSIHWPYGNNLPQTFTDPKYNGLFSFNDGKGSLNWSLLGNIYDSMFYSQNTDGLFSAPQIITQKDVEYIISEYDNGIIATDALIEKIFSDDSMKQIMSNSIIVISSEHGEDLGEHKYIAHYDVYDTQIHTPLIILHPNIKKPITIKQLTSSIDILPTILDMVNIPKPKQIQGNSLASTICGEASNLFNDTVVYSERIPLWEHIVAFVQHPEKIYTNTNIKNMLLHFQADDADLSIRTSEWKYILRRSNTILKQASWWQFLIQKPLDFPEEELYNIVVDPYEQKNVSKDNPEIVQMLKNKLLEKWNNSMSSPPADIQPVVPLVHDYF
jgi:arylsulfatase A-like enzyme